MRAIEQLFLAGALIKRASAQHYNFQASAPLEVALPLAAAGGGALLRAVSPTEADHRHRRGLGQRLLRGAGRGLAVGGGAALGGDLGTAAGGRMGPGTASALGILGGAAGAYAGFKVPEQRNQYE